MNGSRHVGAAAVRFDGRRLVLLALGLALAGSVAQQTWAQTNLSPSAPAGGSDIAGRRRAATPQTPTVAPPDAIPGAKAREPVVPAKGPVGDLAPNDALFDAINRGDIAAARDALNRGAELGAVNILGMTPMELSVDLGRNDISFLLLSMRGEDSGRGSRAVAQGQPQGQAQVRQPAQKSVASAKPAAVAKPIRAQPVAAKPAPTAKLFANDGGTPLPNAGFLGFGGGATN
jgi:hypothetical protein